MFNFLFTFLLEFNQMASQPIFLRVRGTLFNCAAAAEVVRGRVRAQQRGNSECD